MSRHSLLGLHRWRVANMRWIILVAVVAMSVPLLVIWYQRTHITYY